MLEIGMQAPDFSFNSEGKEIKLSDFLGKKVVLYFYPMDNTPGWTMEACGFRDAYDDITDAGAVVIGVSPDSEKAHDKFRKRHNLNFFLASDTEKNILRSYEAISEKNLLGKKMELVIRSTYIISEEGKITNLFPKVNILKHSKDILAALK